MSIIEGVVVGADTGFYTTEIEQSLRFNDDDSAYLSWTPASAGNRKTWTFSTWVKRGNLGTVQGVFECVQSAAPNVTSITFEADNTLRFLHYVSGGVTAIFSTTAVYRDVGAWYHLTLTLDTTIATSADRFKVYVNGVQQTTTHSVPSGSFSQNDDLFINGTTAHYIGAYIGSANLDGYLAETHFIDGTAYDATAFGEFKNGVWIPLAYSGSYGTNGFYLDYSNGASIGADSSGNGNNWTPTNLASTDVMLDSPTNNFATLNPLENTAGYLTYQEGSLKASIGAQDKIAHATNSMPSTGKWYFEYLSTSSSAASVIGLSDKTVSQSSGAGFSGGTFALSNTVSNGVIGGVAFDADALEVKFYLNGSLDKTTSSLSDITWFAAAYLNATSGVFNFGQDSSFAGNKTPQGYTDANGIGDFYYAPPAGYLALCTANLPEPAIGPNSATTADEHFNTVLYTGDGTSSRAITGVGFQPDLNVTATRNTTGGLYWEDAVRGATKFLTSFTTGAEGTASNSIISFDSDGVTIGNNAVYNTNGNSYVAWNWKADNTSGSTNTDGTITSTVSANVDAGFSIVSWTGTGSGSATVGHGLGQAPEIFITKARTVANNWVAYTETTGNANRLLLNSTAASTSDTSAFNSTSPTSSVLTFGVGLNSANDFITYCFHSVEGFSKFGSYTGNGSTDGPMVYTGFRPAFVMVKRTDVAGEYWQIIDSSRDEYNLANHRLMADQSLAENTSGIQVDFISNGFKIRDGGVGENASGGTYIYMAFAELPAKYSPAK